MHKYALSHKYLHKNKKEVDIYTKCAILTMEVQEDDQSRDNRGHRVRGQRAGADTHGPQGDRYGSICILLHTDIQLEQHHLLKLFSFLFFSFFFSYMVLPSLSKTNAHNCTGLFPGLQFDNIVQLLLSSNT